MRLSSLAHERVTARNAWIRIALVAAYLGVMGAYIVHTGHIGRAFYGGLLIFVWTLALISLRRSGRWRVFTWRQALFLGAITVFAGGNLWSHPPAMVAGAASVAGMLLGLGGLLPFIDLRQARDATEKVAIRREIS